MSKRKITPMEMAHFRFALIAPVIQNLYPDASAAAYYRRVAENELTLPDGSSIRYEPKTLQKWVSNYNRGGIDALMPRERLDKGSTRALSDTAIEQIYYLREKYPKVNATMIHTMLLKDGFITENVNVRSVQRFIKANDLKSARNTNIKDRKAFEEPKFGCMWQADTCYLPYITENGITRRTYLIMIIDDHSRLIVGGQIFYNDNAFNFQQVFKQAVATYGIPDKLYLDNGSPYSNEQLTLICDSLGCLELHTPVRDGASKGKVERNFRTLKDRWLNVIDFKQLHSIDEFNILLQNYIHAHNTTVHSGTNETPVARYLLTRDHPRIPKSKEWLDDCFLNRVTRKVNNDSCITISKRYFDAPQQFIGMKVEVRYIPFNMESAFIFYEGKKYYISETNKNENSRTRRNNSLPSIDYGRKDS